MVNLTTIYAISASGIFVAFIFFVTLTIWWRRRLLKEQRANQNLFLEAAPTSVPGVIEPFDYMAHRPESVYPGRPGSGNIEVLLFDQDSTPTFGRDTMSTSLPSHNRKLEQPNRSRPPPPYTEV